MADLFITGRAHRGQVLGTQVKQAAVALPASTSGTIFTVAGGRVMVTQIVGEVTTIIQSQANATKLIATPTVGSAVDLCAALDINGKEVGTLFGITGLLGDAMKGANAGALSGQDRPVIVATGTIQLNTAATNTGAIKWTIHYIPIDDGATVTAVTPG